MNKGKHWTSRSLDLFNERKDTIAIHVSGQKAKLIVMWPVEDTQSAVPNVGRSSIEMSLDDLERFIVAAQDVIKESKAFEASHPQ